MGRTSGAVRSTGLALDRERRDSYELLLEARSRQRVARARLHVAVTDVNDNCPVFVERPYVAAVRAGAEPGTSVLRVHAVDLDANDNGEVSLYCSARYILPVPSSSPLQGKRCRY